MGHDIVISFSSKDLDTALRVDDGLTTRGVKCWISSKDIPAGGNYQNEIVNALRAAKVMVLVFSGHANSSEEIQKELALAAQNRLIVMPLKIDDATPTDGFVYSLAISQWVEIFPDFENNLDKVAISIRNIAERSERFALAVRQALESDGFMGSMERKILEEEATKRGLTIDQARIIIDDVVGGSTRLNALERELCYLQMIAEVLADGIVSSTEKNWLIGKAKGLGISDSRAQVLLEQEKRKLDLSADSMPAAMHSSTPAESVAVTPSINLLQVPSQLVVHDEMLPSNSDEHALPINSTSDDWSWPNIGLNFLKAINRELDVLHLPFAPSWTSDDASIDEDGESTYWYMNDNYYFCVWFSGETVWLDSKSSKDSKVTIYWGFYSAKKLRDPNFRSACKEICATQNTGDSLEEEESFRLNGYLYKFISKGYLGFQTSERPAFEKMIQEPYIRMIVDQLLMFSRELWPLVSKM